MSEIKLYIFRSVKQLRLTRKRGKACGSYWCSLAGCCDWYTQRFSHVWSI